MTFINLADEITVKEVNFKNHKVKFYGSFAHGISKINTISRLLKLLDEKKILKKVSIFDKEKHTSKVGYGWWINECFYNFNFF